MPKDARRMPGGVAAPRVLLGSASLGANWPGGERLACLIKGACLKGE